MCMHQFMNAVDFFVFSMDRDRVVYNPMSEFSTQQFLLLLNDKQTQREEATLY